FAELHDRYRTPWFTILFFSGLAVLLVLPGKTDFLGNLYSFGAMLSFTMAHAAVVVLRVRQPERERPYRVPGAIRIRGSEIPVLPLIGGLGTFTACVSRVILDAEARTVGVAWRVV